MIWMCRIVLQVQGPACASMFVLRLVIDRDGQIRMSVGQLSYKLIGTMQKRSSYENPIPHPCCRAKLQVWATLQRHGKALGSDTGWSKHEHDEGYSLEALSHTVNLGWAKREHEIWKTKTMNNRCWMYCSSSGSAYISVGKPASCVNMQMRWGCNREPFTSVAVQDFKDCIQFN